MFWTTAILWQIINVLEYLIGKVRYYPVRTKKYFFCPILDTSTSLETYFLYTTMRKRNKLESDPGNYGPSEY